LDIEEDNFKTMQIGGSIEHLMPIWHSDSDNVNLMKDVFLIKQKNFYLIN